MITNIIYTCSPDPNRSSRDDIALLRIFAISSCKMRTGHPLLQPTTTCKFSALCKKKQTIYASVSQARLAYKGSGNGFQIWRFLHENNTTPWSTACNVTVVLALHFLNLIKVHPNSSTEKKQNPWAVWLLFICFVFWCVSEYCNYQTCDCTLFSLAN